MSDLSVVELLRSAIVRSGLSAQRYALDVLIRDPRTVRRWVSGESPIPRVVERYLVRQRSRGG